MRVAQFHFVLVQEILGHCTLDSLTIFQLQWERLHLSWTASDVAYTIFSSHCSAMGNFNFQACEDLKQWVNKKVPTKLVLGDNPPANPPLISLVNFTR